MEGSSRIGLWKTFRIPLMIFSGSLAGLIAALLVEGVIDHLASAIAAMPILVLLWIRWRGGSRHNHRSGDIHIA